MRGPVLRSKLRRPALPGDIVPRPRLNEAFVAAAGMPLTVVLAPIGFGKTTAAALWAAQSPIPTAWLTLDDQDSDPVRLFRHLLAALRTAHPGFGEGLDALLLLPEVPGGAALGETLADALHDLPERTALVIDDAHVASDHEAVALLRALVHYPAPDLALVLVTRSAAMIDLGRLLAHAKAASIDAAMLRFTVEEAAAFLAHHGLPDHLAHGLEGWPAGLRLVALSGGAPAAMEQAGVARRGLLMEAALEQIPADHLEPLLAAAVVERISGEVCAVMLGRPGDAAELRSALAHLASSHAFLAPRDSAGEWFSIEPLFREAVLERARTQRGASWITQARLVASDCLAAQGEIDDVISLALLAGDVDRAASLVEAHVAEMEGQLEYSLLEMRLNRLPEAVVQDRPYLLIARAICCVMRAASVSGLAALERAEALLATGSPDERAALWPILLGVRADFALAGAVDFQAAEGMVVEALPLLPEGAPLGRGTEIHIPALAALTRGESEQAIAGIETWARQHRPPNDAYLTSVLLTKAAIHMLDGNPVMAADAASRLGDLARRVHLPSRETWAASMEAIALLMMNDLPAAEAAFERYQALAYGGLMNFIAYQDALFGRALLLRATGQREEGNESIDRYIRRLSLSPNPDLLTLARSFRARLAALDGDIDEAMAMLAMLPESTGRQAVSMVQSIPLTRARVLATWGELAGVRQAVEICRSTWVVAGRAVKVRTRIVEAWAQEALGDGAAAEAALADALALGIERGMVWPFIEDGERIRPILLRLEAAGNVDAAVALALMAHDDDAVGSVLVPVVAAPPTVDDLALTRRELEVLRALRRGLTNKQIADEMYIASSTVKRHTASLFRKLGVTTRTQAVLHLQSVEIFRRSV